ncbi:pirin family protein [Janibacter limosus]|uniref:Pirin family protein n=1 Tax=Janibacter limosus TaxID=53458 RepID=A0A4P6MSV9_9MICO|nr:pirin family protein [Janibacter limosus]QBF46831.1 pirin family protein [Janibacter limosus]
MDDVQILIPREVPLGGPRAMPVRRTLPSRQRSLVGAWCFLDHYGPDDVAATGGMVVPRHPHTSLATVSWLFTGEIEHRDSTGAHAIVRPGELNLMTAGRGVSHSEFSTPKTSTLHGVQLWFALPTRSRGTDPSFDHHVPEPVYVPGGIARVFLGELFGVVSPVATPTPLTGAEIILDADAVTQIEVPEGHEHAVLLDDGDITLEGAPLGSGELGYLAPGRRTITLRSATGARVVLIGGEPLGEQIVMWWNFIGGSHDEVVAAREQWMAEIGGPTGDAGRFGPFPEGQAAPLPAPALPGGRLRPRG